MRTRADLARAAQLAGAVLVDAVPVRRRDGSVVLSGSYEFEDPWAAARLLCILSDEDASDPMVAAWARSIARQCSTAAQFDEAIHANVKAHVRFDEEEGERFQSASTTMIEGVGDCDCHARLVHALARSQRRPAALRFFERDGEPVHVVDAIDGQWAETTIDAAFGEHPHAAYQRLGLDLGERPDLGCCADVTRIGAFDWTHPLPRIVVPSTVENKKAQLDAIVRSLDKDAAACSALDASTRAAWHSFVAGWQVFVAQSVSWLATAAEMDQADEYEQQIQAWQARLGAVCKTAAPSLPTSSGPSLGTVLLAGGALAGAVAIAKALQAWAPSARHA